MNIKVEGLGFILTTVFLVLKLCDVITWSYWWVFAPLWAPLSICLIVIAIGSLGLWWANK